MCISVDLPDPDGPMIATYSPSSMVSGDPSQGGHGEGAGPVHLGHVVELDDRRLAGRPVEFPVGGAVSHLSHPHCLLRRLRR